MIGSSVKILDGKAFSRWHLTCQNGAFMVNYDSCIVQQILILDVL